MSLPCAVESRCLALAAFGLFLLAAAPAPACGVSASGVASCSLAEHEEATRARWVIGVNGLYTWTRLRFDDEIHADQVRYGALALLAYLPSARLVLQAGAGLSLGGNLTLTDGEYQFSPGPIALLGADYRAFDDGRYSLLLTSGLSFASARTQPPAVADGESSEPSATYTAFDLRLGAQFGIALGRIAIPYALARVFGGPVFWHYHGQAVTGTDTHHYQLGAGLAVRATKALNFFAEGIPLGERAIALGVGWSL
ncbi:MAG TPA: hypothetical protein VFK05_34065 [Polyangiaceae bacterium]|nr:hypothetical protein [Polyangiaceae bacterium]